MTSWSAWSQQCGLFPLSVDCSYVLSRLESRQAEAVAPGCMENAAVANAGKGVDSDAVQVAPDYRTAPD